MSSDWDIEQATDLYQVGRWGKGFFSVNEAGHMQVHVNGDQAIDLKTLCEDLAERGLHAPVLLRFSDILKGRMRQLFDTFARARQEAGYEGRYYGVYPIKVNQQCQVVEEIIDFGAELNWGLEAGSKPELHATLAMLEDVEGLIVCNGYKDREFIYLALLGQKMGKQVFIVIEKLNELQLIIEVARELDVTPLIGLRCRLSSSGKGKWEESGGDNSKFGLSTREILDATALLEKEGMLEALKLLHFHIGSQVPQIRFIKQALQEAGRFFVELRRLGAPIEFIDVGGGLGVDYDGSISGSHSSVDYSLKEYANDIVWALKSVCDEEEMPHPHIISESGRALVAHHAVLVMNVLGVSERSFADEADAPEDSAPPQLRQLHDTLVSLPETSIRESYHDAVALREDLHRLFMLGHCTLADRAAGDGIYWRIMHEVQRMAVNGELPEQDMEQIRQLLADRYFCNLSVFQSLPDAWAIQQVFPVVPLHRLEEAPTRQAMLEDITCDSDGRLQRFPTGDGIVSTLPLHPFDGEPYLLGVFLVGAYQEILGDLHNLFGDTHAVHVRMDGDHYELEQVVEGESVSEVLDYVQFHEKVLIDRMRRQIQGARSRGLLSAREANRFLRFYQAGLRGYTYLEEHAPPL